ncbi:MAG: xylose isomerase [Rhodobacteraceae bacterium]|uniref:sugar phosphate isomerase/epimerase family protein n=1 Tax=Cypionkella sp. TaxID=2811411 RepID=UPI00132ADE5F|nr:sugar phosphate isomerase/epimerase family protein [Cypionkella sp.]KAF0173283.1 MAG: xylose isomerase [Paracoccaceae bacterium]MDO8326879.1 sugar phosphate isomerase/epimerase family protein [Cypionkella sp.]
MTLPNAPRYATRLNAFKVKGGSVAEMIAGAGRVGGLDAADLNFPDHFEAHSPAQLGRMLADQGMVLNGLAMRYYTEAGFKLGAFTHPDRAMRAAAIDLTKRGLDACAEMGGRLMTLWMGQDGYDYSFQMDYARAWEDSLAAIAEVADHNPGLDIAIEYKPDEPRAFALMPDMATTLLALREVNRANTGVTLDFAHVLYAGEMPAYAATLAARHSRILGVHLNDGYGKRDDGLMAGTVHPIQTLELFVALDRAGYDGVIYFDTFPDHAGLDPVAESRANIALTDRLRDIARRLSQDPDLARAIAAQDAAASTRLLAKRLYG